MREEYSFNGALNWQYFRNLKGFSPDSEYGKNLPKMCVIEEVSEFSIEQYEKMLERTKSIEPVDI